ncbi:(3R)-3-hydroxyacyl-CoA dehydrogenase-like [Styela clava]
MEETSEVLDSDPGNTHCTIKTDVTSSGQATEAFKIAEEKLGKKITVLVNCAGIATNLSSFDQMEETFFFNVFNDIFRVNLKGTFIMRKQFLLSLANFNTTSNDTRATVVNISSIAGIKGITEMSNYVASKFKVVGITKTLALVYGKHEVRCHACTWPDHNANTNGVFQRFSTSD